MADDTNRKECNHDHDHDDGYRNIETTAIGKNCMSRQTSTTASLLTGDRGHSENDATHFRLRDGTSPNEYYTCLSCGLTFTGTNSLLPIYEHYSETIHTNYFGDCFYCQGRVHQYYHKRENRLCYYHDCLRWKRGDDR